MDNTPLLYEVEIEAEELQENSPVEQVALTVPIWDEPSLPAMTFRTWFLGVTSCVLLSFLNQFFWYRTEPLSISSAFAQITVLPLGHLMARTITKRPLFEGSALEFQLNPGPFNVKEHVLITVFASAGAEAVYAIHIISAVKVFYRRDLTLLVSFLVVFTTQVLGFGWAGIFRRYLVDSAAMWWPENMVQVSLFRALHEKEVQTKGRLTRTQFFLIALVCSFAYYVFPGFLFPALTSLSWLCWVFPNSVLAQQLGSGLHGLGLGTIGFDWSTVKSYLGSPLATPLFATANVAAGFILNIYVITVIAYWLDIYKAKSFPIFSDGLFAFSGQRYNISGIIDSNFHLDVEAYERNGPLYLSVNFAVLYGMGFATLTATIVHVLLFHGREMWALSKSALQCENMDIHTRLMQRYKKVPDWWFILILLLSMATAIFACEYYNEQLQLRWWGVLLACALALVYTLPIGIIAATANQRPTLNIITEFIIGYLYPGRPVANICFKVYGFISMKQALKLLQDFKLGHYMKICPRAMFTAQISGTIISSVVHLATAWWMMTSISNICNTALLPPSSPWRCPSDRVFYDASVIWGLIGPRRIFGNLGIYSGINWFFLLGAIAPLVVWLGHRRYPDKNWIRLVNIPVFLGATINMPPATPINYTCWIIIGFLFNFVIYRYRRSWWQRHNYVLSGALDAGVAFMAVLLHLSLGSQKTTLDWWGGHPDRCPLASCPTAKGVQIKGCPVF